MKPVCFAAAVLGCVGIGAWLVVENHPWFALLSMLIGAGVNMRDDATEDKP